MDELKERLGLKYASQSDDFWDISELLPQKKTSPKPTREGRVAAPTTSLRDEVCDESEKNITVREYSGDGALRRVKISPWPTKFTFYSRFAAQAKKLWRKKVTYAEYADFFSYMPQYEYMTYPQLSFYLYFRDKARHGEYISANCGYVLLYLYEIINVTDIPPKSGANLIAHIWGAYRKEYPYLDKYAGEWLCDYCLIYDIPIPYDIISPFLDEAAPNLSLPELYYPNDAAYKMMAAYSRYDIKKSKYYAENAEFFETHIKAAFEAGMEEYMRSDEYKNIEPAHVCRDSFSGAVACRDVKFKLEIWYRAMPHWRGAKDVVAGIFKLCENNVRAVLGIKARLKTDAVREDVSRAVNAYFDNLFPDRDKKKKKQEETEEYMKLYEPENSGVADISHALDIERDAWQTALELEGEDAYSEQDETEAENAFAPSGEYDGDVSSALRALSPKLLTVLRAAMENDIAAACAEVMMPVAEAERLINEAAYDAIGDALIENGKIIDDYRDEIKSSLGM